MTKYEQDEEAYQLGQRYGVILAHLKHDLEVQYNKLVDQGKGISLEKAEKLKVELR